jgi:hypothetical protein
LQEEDGDINNINNKNNKNNNNNTNKNQMDGERKPQQKLCEL